MISVHELQDAIYNFAPFKLCGNPSCERHVMLINPHHILNRKIYNIKPAARAPNPPTNTPMPAVAMAPAAEEEPVAAAAVSLGATELAELDSEWPAWLSSALSVVLDHSAVNAGAVLLEHESPTVVLEPVAKLTAAHYRQRSAAARILQMTCGKLTWYKVPSPEKSVT
jgi:hypothetical protein